MGRDNSPIPRRMHSHFSAGGLPPPGTTITREYKGAIHEVVVLQDGFEYQGQRHANLSRIAKLITGETMGISRSSPP